MGKANRVRYSRWDGTQVGFELDATDIFSEITDDLLYHGDLNAALRRMMQSGFQDANGERLQGLREMLDQLRKQRREALENHDLGGVYDDIAKELREVVQQEREAIDELVEEARESGDERRQELTEEVAAERHASLDLLSPDLAGMVRDLQSHDFTSSEAREQFELAYATRPDDPTVLELLSDSMLAAGDEADLYDLLHTRAEARQTAEAWFLLGRYMVQAGDIDVAERALLTAARMDGGQTAEVQVALADFYESVGDRENALERLRMAL